MKSSTCYQVGLSITPQKLYFDTRQLFKKSYVLCIPMCCDGTLACVNISLSAVYKYHKNPQAEEIHFEPFYSEQTIGKATGETDIRSSSYI